MEEAANDQIGDAQNEANDMMKEPQSNNTDELSSADAAQEGMEAATPAETSAAEGMGETTAAEAGVQGETAAEAGAAESAAATEAAEAEIAATEAAAAETAAAETAGGAAAAEGTAAAGGASAGGAAAGGAAIGTVGWALLIVLVIILIIIILIGVAGFFLTMPQFLWNKLKKLALDIWDGLQGYVIGMDEALVNEDDVIGVAQYLHDMGYDLVGMGFAEEVEIYGQNDKNGNEIPVPEDHVKNEIKEIDAPYLRAYLVAENRTYLINNYTFNLKDFFNSFFDGSFFKDGMDTWGTGLIDLDQNLIEALGMPALGLRIGEYNLGELIQGVKIDRETNTLRIRRLNLELAFWKSHNDYTYYNLNGWSGRYGKPFELMLTLHIATMAPDLVKEFALNKDLDAKVHVKLKETKFSGKVYVDGKSIEDLEKELVDTGQVDENGEPIMECVYSEETIAALKELERDTASEIKTAVPYISSVTNHWFRNVYFEGTKSVGASSSTEIGIDEDKDKLEDYNEATGVKTLKTRNLTADDNVYSFESTEEEIKYTDTIPGITGKITFKGNFSASVVQNKDAVRGVTNPTTKKLFGEKYYIYDGTVTTAQEIQKARKEGDDSLKQPVTFTKDSLSAFTILESSETLDAQFIYRDLKELVIELGYFEREDFDVIEKEVLEWPIPKYRTKEWPNRKYEKQILEYGTLMLCKESVEKIKESESAAITEIAKTESENADGLTDEIVTGDAPVEGDLVVSTSKTDISVDAQQILEEAKKVKEQFCAENWTYHQGNSIPLSSRNKYVDCSSFVCQVLYNCGFTDLAGHQKTCSGGTLPKYCEQKGWTKIENKSELQPGDIIFTGTNGSGNPTHTFIYITDSTSYDCGSTRKIQGSVVNSYNFSSYEFRFAYRVAESSKLTGFEEDLDVIAMANGKVTELLDEGNNLFSMTGLSQKLYGTPTVEINPYEPSEQTDEGIRIKLTDAPLKGYTLIMYGFDVDDSITVGQKLEVSQVIGKTKKSNICLILLDKDKAVIENIEENIKIPKALMIYDDYDVSDETNFVTDIEDFKKMFSKYKNITANAQAFLDMQEKYQVNAVFAACVTIAESSGGTAWAAIAPSTYNWFSIKGSYRGQSYISPTNNKGPWRKYPSFAAAVDDFGDLIANAPYYYKRGKKFVSEIGPVYCNEEWAVTVNKLMTTAYEKVI